MRWLWACVWIWCAAGFAAAQTVISPDEFLEIAEGKTLTFVEFPTGRPVGVEQFLSRSQTLWRFTGSYCVRGEVIVQGQYLCFVYEDSPGGLPICWVPYRQGDRLMVRTPELIGADIQEITAIHDQPLDCHGTPMS